MKCDIADATSWRSDRLPRARWLEEELVELLRQGPIAHGNADSAAIWLVRGESLTLVAGTHRDRASGEMLVRDLASFGSVDMADAPEYRRVITTGVPFIGRPGTRIGGQPTPASIAHNVRSVALIPIGDADLVMGVLALGSDEPDRFDRRDLQKAFGYAEELGALLQARDDDVVEAMSAKMSRLRALNDLALGLVGARTVDEIGRELMRDGLRLAGADGGSLVIRDGQQMSIVDSFNLADDVIHTWRTFELEPGSEPFSDVVETGTAHFFSDPEEFVAAYPTHRSTIDTSGDAAWAVLPLIEHDRVFGAIGLTFERPTPFGAAHRMSLFTLATLGSDALSKAVEDRNNQSALGRLRESLMPSSLPTLDGYELSAEYRPVANPAEVGGDWYDAFLIDDARLAITIGDVVGRGIDAAGATGRIRAAIRALAMSESEPARLVERLDAFCADLPAAFGATTVIATIDLATGRVELCRAGHVPPVRVPVDGTPVLHMDGGTEPLIQELASRREKSVFSLRNGEALLLYTDGLIERRGEHLDEGFDRLTSRASALSLGDLDEAIEALVDDLAGDDRGDDVAVIALRRCGPRGRERQVR